MNSEALPSPIGRRGGQQHHAPIDGPLGGPCARLPQYFEAVSQIDEIGARHGQCPMAAVSGRLAMGAQDAAFIRETLAKRPRGGEVGGKIGARHLGIELAGIDEVGGEEELRPALVQ